jgi:ArsR family transcriptional regulator, arsenate/arsenite/antimonite-responsive transcriptional repressor
MTRTTAPLPVVETAGCCSPGLVETLSRPEAVDIAAMFKALADPARLQLLALIKSSENGEACVCDLTEPVGLSQPTVSHHLKVLADAGLVRREKRGIWAWYALVPERLAEIADVLR